MFSVATTTFLFQVVSYAKFLYPTNALVVRKPDSHSAVPLCRASAPRSIPASRYKAVAAKSLPAGTDLGKDSCQLLSLLLCTAEKYGRNILSETIAKCKMRYWEGCAAVAGGCV